MDLVVPKENIIVIRVFINIVCANRAPQLLVDRGIIKQIITNQCTSRVIPYDDQIIDMLRHG
jgi:hypothetical protein